MNDGAALGLVLDQVSKDKNIDRAVLVETLEQAILTAAKRSFGMHREMEAKFNEESGRVEIECDGRSYQLPIDGIAKANLVPNWEREFHRSAS